MVLRRGGDDGCVDKKEFRTNVLSLGLEAEPRELDALFDGLDGDGGGSLDMTEIRGALRKLQDEAAVEVKRESTLRREVAELQKAAKAAQAEWRRTLKADAAAAKEEAERTAREAEERAAAAAVLKAQKAAAAAEKKAAAAAEKAAFEAKVKERQMKQKNAVSAAT